MNGPDVKRDSVAESIDPIALGCCLRACIASDTEKQAFLQTFQNADHRGRYQLLQRKRQMLLHVIHEKEEALEQIDYMMHLLTRSSASLAEGGGPRSGGRCVEGRP